MYRRYKDTGSCVPAFKVSFPVEEVACMQTNNGKCCDVSGVLETQGGGRAEGVIFCESAKVFRELSVTVPAELCEVENEAKGRKPEGTRLIKA